MVFLDKLTAAVQDRAARAQSRAAIDAALAAAALVATADGEVTLAKRVALDKALGAIEAFRGLNPQAAAEIFDSHAYKLRARRPSSRERVLKAVAGTAGDEGAVETVTQTVSAIAHAEDGASIRTVKEIAAISEALGRPAIKFGSDIFEALDGVAQRPQIITLGNAKGGSGKSTLALHLIVALLRRGLKVGALDLDASQGTLSAFFGQRAAARETDPSESLPMPTLHRVERSTRRGRDLAESEESAAVAQSLHELAEQDVVVIDTPGSLSHLGRLGHWCADILVTPMNDSLLDVDVLARINRQKREVQAPSPYCAMVREVRGLQEDERGCSCGWIVVRNRLGHVDSHNARDVTLLLTQLSQRLDFVLASGLSERVIYRALFDRGLTLFDLDEEEQERWRSPSHARARAEVLSLVDALEFEGQPDVHSKALGRDRPAARISA